MVAIRGKPAPEALCEDMTQLPTEQVPLQPPVEAASPIGQNQPVVVRAADVAETVDLRGSAAVRLRSPRQFRTQPMRRHHLPGVRLGPHL